MNSFENQYFRVLEEILHNGSELTGRNGLTKYVFGASIKHDLRLGFPILTSRKMNFELAVEEFLWDVSGSRNVNDLNKARMFWDPWADDSGYLSTSYGVFLRGFPGVSHKDLKAYKGSLVGASWKIDQLAEVRRELIHDPTNRRLVVSLYHPGYAYGGEVMPSCHPMLVFSSDGVYLDLLIMGRSNDMAVGFPWDIQRYSLLATCLAQDAQLIPRFVQFTNANSHIYENCFKPVSKLLERSPKEELPKLVVAKKSIFSLTRGDFALEGYRSDVALKFPFNE